MMGRAFSIDTSMGRVLNLILDMLLATYKTFGGYFFT